MTPQIRTTYLALSKTGRLIQTFDHADAGHRFVAERKAMGVTIELVEETTVRRPCPKRRGGGLVASLAERRVGNG